jgi:hypothetical protein
MKLPITSMTITALGLVSWYSLLAKLHKHRTFRRGASLGRLYSKQPDQTRPSIQSSVDAFRAALGDSNGNNPGPAPNKGSARD